MDNKEMIALYLSGLADKKTERQTENALLRDASFFESFIETVEHRLYPVSAGFASAVMGRLPNSPAAAVKVPVLSRKLCAAVCFCSAAAIILFTVSGFDRHIIELISSQSFKINDWIDFAKNLTLGG